jgi:hypothetical protein
MERLSNIYQIFYDETTRKKNVPAFAQYDNTGKLDAFFENTPIYHLLQDGQHLKGPYFGVLSPAFMGKAMGIRVGVDLKLLNDTLAKGPALLAFNRRSQQKNTVAAGIQIHGPEFRSVFKHLFPELDPSRRQRTIIYMNYVIATPEIWERYKAFFVPLYERMRDAEGELWELLFTDSRYPKKLPESAKQSLGLSYYPLHTFVCERFWSIFLDQNTDIPVTTY